MQIYDTEKYQKKLQSISPNLELLEEYTVSSDNLKHRCNVCGGEFYATSNNTLRGKGCPYCVGRKVLVGYNDIQTTHPEIAELLVNESDKTSYIYGTYTKLLFKCKACGKEFKSRPVNVKRTESCKFCKDGISYPEKFMISFLNQLNINYVYQLSKTNFDWCGKYKYDFYFEYDNKSYIIETNGIQHYEKAFTNKKGKTLEDNIQNDKCKRRLAVDYVDEYIELDCRKSDSEYIINSIKNSLLSIIFSLDDIDFISCQKYALSSIIVNVCNDYNLGLSISDLVDKYKVSNGTINRYLHEGNYANICSYNADESKKKSFGKAVICLNTLKKYGCLTDAGKECNVSPFSINESCKKHRILNTSTEFNKWMYLNEYEELNGVVPDYQIIDNHLVKVRCINTNEVFNSIADARRWNHASGIDAVLKGVMKTSGRHPETNEKLRWEYA